MPSRMCINPIHNKKGILHHSVANATSEEMWAGSSCAMDSLYDVDRMSETIPVILDNSKEWYHVLETSMKLGARGVAHVQGVSRVELKQDTHYSGLLLINRTASPLSWFMECKDRNNRSAIMLPYSFLPSMAARKLRDAAEKSVPTVFYGQISSLLYNTPSPFLWRDYRFFYVSMLECFIYVLLKDFAADFPYVDFYPKEISWRGKK
ncbi:uncharacterized protein DS421_18g604360 [Arachis hypogaea]|nr:uncharacterized protein DS421_18g604360 [Arachis hypogaea]